ncbi:MULTISPECIES: cyclic lactone autoinducer peptide [Paenibacillus]|nr:cyclic lactone autoinducer peptide [Paenibacillus caseinilyticus]MCZ8518100.1 cyclic lactone autoinducer peptide [Paenibacillus caseinilyticus]
MKRNIAKIASIVLTIIASMFAYTNSIFVHRPETPEELLKK